MEHKKTLRYSGLFLFLAGIFVVSNIYTLIPLYNMLETSFQADLKAITAASSFFTLFYACGLLIFGPCAERFGKKQVLMWGLFFSSLSTCLIGFADHVLLLYLFRSIQGITLATFAPVAFAYSFDLFPPKQRTFVIACVNTGFLLAGTIGQLLSTYIATIFHWEAVFYFFSVIYALLFIIAFKLLPPVQKRRTTINKLFIFSAFLNLLKTKDLLKLYSITFPLLLSFAAFYDGLTNKSNFSTDMITTIRLLGLFGATLSLFTGRLINRIGVKKTYLFSVMVATFSLSLFLFTTHPAIIGCASILFVASIAMMIPTVISWIGNIAENARANAISLYSFLLLLGVSLSPILVSSFTFKQLILILLTLFLICLCVVRTIQTKKGQERSTS